METSRVQDAESSAGNDSNHCDDDDKAKNAEDAQTTAHPTDATRAANVLVDDAAAPAPCGDATHRASEKGGHGNVSGLTVTEKTTAPPRTPVFVLVLTCFAALGGFLLGYDIGIVSGSMLYVQPHFELDTGWTEAVVSGALGAAAVTALAGGWLTDLIGRRHCLLSGSMIFSVGGVVMGAATYKEVLLAGRMVCGMGIGIASVVVPIYVAESSPVHQRGRLTLMWQILINFGVMLSSIIAGAFSSMEQDGWRYMLGLSAVPGLVQFVGFLFMPESPRWLVDKGRLDQARAVLTRIRGCDDVTEELNDIQKSVEEARKQKLKGCQQLVQIWRTKPVRRAVLVGVGLLFFQQWCGINTAIYYSGTVLKMAGFPAKSAVWLVVLPNALLFLAGFIGVFVVDRIGRRPLLISSMVGTMFGIAIIAVGFQLSAMYSPAVNSTLVELMENGTEIYRCQRQYTTCDSCVKDSGCGFCYSSVTSSGTCLPSSAAGKDEVSLYGRCNSSAMEDLGLSFTYGYCPSSYNWITVVGLALFVFLFSPGMAPMPWTINAEIYPLWARGTCTSLAAATAWASNLVISSAFLSLIEAITTYGTFWMFTGFCFLGLVFFVISVPETKNKSLEQVEELFMTTKELRQRGTQL